MGYESRLIIGKRIEHLFDGEPEKNWIFFQELGRYNLCKMNDMRIGGKSFCDLFDREADFDMFVEDDDHPLRIDKYGELCKYTTPDRLLPWLKKYNALDAYWRIPPLIALLEALKTEENLIIVHYGY